MIKDQEIRIKKDIREDGTILFWISVYYKGVRHEAYRPVIENEVPIFMSHLIAGFDPPKEFTKTCFYPVG